MRKSFASLSDFTNWLSEILATDHMESIYEETQLQLGDVCIPVGSTHHRRIICKRLSESLAPVFPFLTWESIHTLERSDCRGDFFRYQADNLMADLYMDDNPPVVTILTFETGVVTRHELYVEECHIQGLSLEHVWRTAVLHSFADSTLPFDYILTGSCFHLTDRTDGYTKTITCRDTNIYERAYELWFAMESRHWQKQQGKKNGKELAS